MSSIEKAKIKFNSPSMVSERRKQEEKRQLDEYKEAIEKMKAKRQAQRNALAQA
jgi:sugar-specific transcriptional regulator TrmB